MVHNRREGVARSVTAALALGGRSLAWATHVPPLLHCQVTARDIVRVLGAMQGQVILGGLFKQVRGLCMLAQLPTTHHPGKQNGDGEEPSDETRTGTTPQSIEPQHTGT